MEGLRAYSMRMSLVGREKSLVSFEGGVVSVLSEEGLGLTVGEAYQLSCCSVFGRCSLRILSMRSRKKQA